MGVWSTWWFIMVKKVVNEEEHGDGDMTHGEDSEAWKW